MITINNPNTTERLIQEVRARPPLWDQRNLNYHNRIVVNALWQDIADLLKVNSTYRNHSTLLSVAVGFRCAKPRVVIGDRRRDAAP